ncbi:MAG: tRNA pseudouridine(55) synthase TruB [Actinobacteria bacterium]|nr:tRNA pseudouridine(55) synthase TruB [Actinomycetota bacterium]
MNEAGAGLVLVDKEAGPSSFSVVRRVGHAHGLKAGHAGTLDPFATGLLVCLLGRATRLARYLVGLDKRYVVTIRLGLRTSTGDVEGEETESTPVPGEEEILSLRGEVELPVPAASAVKIDGERAYRLHRRGVVVEMPTRRSTVHALEILRYEPPEVVLDLHVSSGTYVRSIAACLGGHCTALRRTAVGQLLVDEADEAHLRPPLDALSHLPHLALSAEEERLVRTGRSLNGHAAHGAVALVRDGVLVGVGRAEGGLVRPETVIA